ncbi:MFS transporter [Bacillus alveayuensis]|uniref:MFS transporter n=1 Tax=Aeribacillus alveayuensis TaxID=279215 RepID=UPI0005CD3D6D|nr:MFS transporter [Bacillus alveayuensis]
MMEEKLWTKNFMNISICNFFLFINYYYLLVTLPIFVIQDLKSSEALAGLIAMVYLFAAIISRPFVDQFMKKIGKRKMLVISLIIFVIASVSYLFVRSIVLLLIIRFLHGIGFGIATTTTGAIVADIVPDSRKGEGMGYFILSSNFAMVVGPFLGLSSYDHWGSFAMLAIALICSVGALFTGGIINLHETKSLRSKKELFQIHFNLEKLLEVSVFPIALNAAFLAFAYSTVLSFVSVYAERLQLGASSNLFFVVYAIILLISRPFTGRWFDKFGANVIVIPSIISFALGLFILSMAHTSFVYLLSALLIGLGWGTLFPSFQTMAIQVVSPSRRASALSTFLSIFDIGIGVGSFLTGAVVSFIGFQSLYFYSSFYVLVGLVLYFLFVHQRVDRKSILNKKSTLQ